MKKFLMLVSIMMSLMFVGAHAQNSEHSIKYLPLNAVFNSTSLEMEFRENNNSIIVDVSIPVNGNAINRTDWFIPGISKDFESFTMGTTSVLAGYRHYIKTNKKFLFYYQTTLKAQTLSFWSKMKYPVGSDLTGYIYATSLGEQIGYQYKINNNLLIEAFLGPEFSRANGRIHSNSTNDANAAQMLSYVKNRFNQSPLGVASDKFTVGQYQGVVAGELTRFLYLWPRFGISIGYWF